MPISAVQRFIYRNLTQRPRVNRALDRFGNRLNRLLERLGVQKHYAIGLTRSKATLFASQDPNMQISQQTVSEAKEALRKMDRTRANLALGEYRRMERGFAKINMIRGKINRHLLLATALSFLLHIGTLALAGLFTKIPPKSSHPIEAFNGAEVQSESQKLSEAERALMLSKLNAEEQEFIQQLLQDLHQGQRSISISDFMIKSEVLDHNIKSLRSGSENLIEENKVRERYETILEEAKKWISPFEKNAEKIDALHQFAHHRILRGYLAGSSILKTLQTGIYNCASSTFLLTALEDDLVGTRRYGIVVFDDHLRSWFLENKQTLWEIENTDGNPTRRTPYTKGLRVPKEMFIAAYLIKNGVALNQLPQNLARFYRRGAKSAASGNGDSGFPPTGVVSGLTVPEGFVPNPYFGIIKPNPVARNLKDFYDKMIETSKIIRKARMIATMISLYREPQKIMPDMISLSFIKIPDGIDWCEIARNENGELRIGTLGVPQPDGLNEQITGDVANIETYFYNLLYAPTVTVASLLFEKGHEEFESCTQKNEYDKFKATAQKILNGEIVADQELFDNFTRAMSAPGHTRELLIKIYRANNLDLDVRQAAFALLMHIHSPEDFEFFRKELLGASDIFIKVYSILALREMRGEMAKKAAELFFSELQKENTPYLKYSFMVGLAKLGYGMEALKYLDANLTLANEKRTLTNRVLQLYPDREPTQEDLQYLKGLIEKEGDAITRANLIAILASAGEETEAISHAVNMVLPLLLNQELPDKTEAEQLVLSLGKIFHPQIREMLLSVFMIHPELVLEIGDIFARQEFRSEIVIEELKRVLNNTSDYLKVSDDPELASWRRTYAALLLILMGELQTNYHSNIYLPL
jgi:hypothetical protein